MMITIIGIPFGMQTLKLAGLALWPSSVHFYLQRTSGSSAFEPKFLPILLCVFAAKIPAVGHFGLDSAALFDWTRTAGCSQTERPSETVGVPSIRCPGV